MHTLLREPFLAVLCSFLLAAHAPGAEPKPEIADLKPDILRFDIKTINDPAAYEFYGGKDKDGQPVWTNDFEKIKPLLEWDNNMGCVTVTYNPVLTKYIMCVTDGGHTVSRMNTYLLEADRLDGDWKVIAYLKEFGTQAYFVNIPSKFIGEDGVTMWLLYSGNFSLDQNEKPHPVNPPGGHYGLTFQKIQLLRTD